MIYLITNQNKFDLDFFDKCTVQECLDHFKSHKYVSVDTETEGFDPYLDKILTLQLGDNKDTQFVIDATTIDLLQFKDLLESKDKVLLFQNAKFDLRFLYYLGIVPENVYDTYLAEAVINKGDKYVRKSLDALADRYCNVILDKSIRGAIHKDGLTKEVVKYAADDVKYLFDIAQRQLKKIKKHDLFKSLELENRFVKVLAYIEYSGIYIDRQKWIKKIQTDTKNFQEAKRNLNNWIIKNNLVKYIDAQLDLFDSERKCKINWSSSQQVIPLLQDLGINTEVKDRETGELKNSADAKVLISQKDKSPFVDLYLKYKGFEKITTTYGDTFLKQIHPITNRIHSTFTQIMDTGRLSSGGKNKNTKEDYVNLQNIPADKHTRHCFTASKDNLLINADYSGQEQIVFANWAKDLDIIEFYKKKEGDMHSFVASKIYPELKEISLLEIPKLYPEKRQIAKAAGFAINYGGTGLTIANNLGVSIEQGNEIYESYFKAFPGVKKYFKKVKEETFSQGYILFNNITKSKCFIHDFDEYKKLEDIVTTYGFWEDYREEKSKHSYRFKTELKPLVTKYFRKKGEIERKALNYPIQGSSAEITKLASIYLFNALKKRNLLFTVLFSNVVHDELLVETPSYLAAEIAQLTQECMEKAGDVFCKIIKLKASPIIAKVWTH